MCSGGLPATGAHGVFHTAKILELATTLPVKIEAVDSENMINSVLPDITSIMEKGLIEVSDITVIKCSGGEKS